MLNWASKLLSFKKPQTSSTIKSRDKIRWVEAHDKKAILEIENLSFEYPWTENQFVTTVKQYNYSCMVAERDGEILGYFVYHICPLHFEIINFAVHPDVRRAGVGTALVQKLKKRLSDALIKRTSIFVCVREKNLPAQLFFRELGFTAIKIEPKFFDDPFEDGYLMRWTLPTANRLKQYFHDIT